MGSPEHKTPEEIAREVVDSLSEKNLGKAMDRQPMPSKEELEEPDPTKPQAETKDATKVDMNAEVFRQYLKELRRDLDEHFDKLQHDIEEEGDRLDETMRLHLSAQMSTGRFEGAIDVLETYAAKNYHTTAARKLVKRLDNELFQSGLRRHKEVVREESGGFGA